jgi:hypothetical protein
MWQVVLSPAISNLVSEINILVKTMVEKRIAGLKKAGDARR